MGEGRERKPSSLAPTLQLSLTYTGLCPFLSICLCLLPLLAINLYSSPHPPCLALFLVGLQDVLFWGPGSPLIESGSRESLADWDQDFQGLRRGRGRHRGVPVSELGVRAGPSFCPSSHYFLGPLSPWRLLCFGPTEAHLESVTSASPGRSGAAQAQAPWALPAQHSSWSPCSLSLGSLCCSVTSLFCCN